MSMGLAAGGSDPQHDNTLAFAHVDPLGFEQGQWRIDYVEHALAHPTGEFVNSG